MKFLAFISSLMVKILLSLNPRHTCSANFHSNRIPIVLIERWTETVRPPLPPYQDAWKKPLDLFPPSESVLLISCYISFIQNLSQAARSQARSCTSVASVTV